MTRHESLKKWIEADGDSTLSLDYPLTDDSIVFDVGGLRGDWTAALLSRVSLIVPTIYIFEPVPRLYDCICDRFREQPKVIPIGEALSDTSGEAMMTDDEEASSLHLAMADTRVLTRDVEEFLELYQIQNVDLASINIEGHEFPLLNRMIDSGAVKKFDNIQIQFHAFYPNADVLRQEIQAKLSETHDCRFCYPFVWESWKRK